MQLNDVYLENLCVVSTLPERLTALQHMPFLRSKTPAELQVMAASPLDFADGVHHSFANDSDSGRGFTLEGVYWSAGGPGALDPPAGFVLCAPVRWFSCEAPRRTHSHRTWGLVAQLRRPR